MSPSLEIVWWRARNGPRADEPVFFGEQASNRVDLGSPRSPRRSFASRMNLEPPPSDRHRRIRVLQELVRCIFGPACLYGQVIKIRSNDRIVKVERKAIISDAWQLEETLRDSEDSSKPNTSFVERLNLTIRQGWKERLDDHLQMLRSHYNFVRPHTALKLGGEVRTPAMEAG